MEDACEILHHNSFVILYVVPQIHKNKQTHVAYLVYVFLFHLAVFLSINCASSKDWIGLLECSHTFLGEGESDSTIGTVAVPSSWFEIDIAGLIGTVMVITFYVSSFLQFHFVRGPPVPPLVGPTTPFI